MLNIIAQLLGAIGIIVFLFCFHGKTVKNMLRVKLLVDIIWAAHYLLLGAISGFSTNLVCSLREIVFMNNDKKFFKGGYWLWLFFLLNWVFAIASWQGAYSLIPAFVSSLATYSFWQKNVMVTRYIALTNNICMFIYDIFVASYAGMIGELLSFISVLIAILSFYFKKEATKAKL